MTEQKEYTTYNLFEVAAVEYLSGIIPDDVRYAEGSDFVVFAYNDKSELPAREEVIKLSEAFRNIYSRYKKKAFAIIDAGKEKNDTATT